MQQSLKRAPIHSEILTVMFTDMADYTKTTAQLSREEFHSLLDVFDRLSLPIFDQFGGHVVKKIGDAFLLTFKSPTNAVLCGIELQRAFRRYRRHTGQPVRIRVAIHTGEVIHRNDDVYGDAVNAASRIESVADADQVTFSEGVFSAMNKTEVPTVYLGAKKLKGLQYPMNLFRVRTVHDDVRQRWAFLHGIITRSIAIGLLVIILAVAARVLWLNGDLFFAFG